ncbi:MAG: TatD family hydrolase [Candidatus Eisenbacteria bacterium]
MIDSHAHLTMRQYRKDLHAVITRAREGGVTAMINVGFDVASSEAGVHLAGIHEDVYAAVGVHPHDARNLNADLLEKLEDLADDPKVVAIGEIGLDFYRNLSPRQSQERAFRRQIDLARKKGLPIVVHDREAHRRTLEILKDEKVTSGVLHCFSGDVNLARQATDLGLYISFAGPITYNGKDTREILKRVPLDRVLVETDCPYLTPVPFRGKRNEPAYVKFVLAKIAGILSRPVDEIAYLTETNARTLFNLPGGC